MDAAAGLDWPLIQDVIISLGLGAIIGLERQSHQAPDDYRETLGVRTFALASLLGTVSTHAADILPGILYVTGAGYVALICLLLYFEFRYRKSVPGITTQVSSMLVFVLGVMVPSNPVFSAALAVIVASILSVKNYTHQFVSNLSDEEILSTMKFLLVTVVLLPVLPNAPIDPWGIYNPRELWALVVLISGITFLGYFAIRFMGRGRGLSVTGALGGLASSTAVTLSMCQRVSQAPGDRLVTLAATFAILVANAIMSVRVTIEVAVTNAELLTELWFPIVAMAVPGSIVAGALFVWLIRAQEDGGSGKEDGLELDNPFQLGPALKFGLLFVGIIGAVEVARIFYGNSGTYLAALLSGFVGVNAISIALARMAENGNLSAIVATRGIVIAILANSLVKGAIASFLGSKKLGLYVTVGLIPMIAAGIGVSFVFL